MLGIANVLVQKHRSALKTIIIAVKLLSHGLLEILCDINGLVLVCEWVFDGGEV